MLKEFIPFIVLFWMVIFGIYIKSLTIIIQNANKKNEWLHKKEKIDSKLSRNKTIFKYFNVLILSSIILILNL